MTTLESVLRFIELSNLSVRSFEVQIGLPNGTLKNAQNRKADLSPDVISKIVEKLSKQFEAKGFVIVDLSTVGGQGYSIIDGSKAAQAAEALRHISDALGFQSQVEHHEQGIKKKLSSVTGDTIPQSELGKVILNLSDSHKIISEANLALSRSNESLARSNEEMVSMVKSATAGGPAKTAASEQPISKGLLEFVVGVATGKRYLSKEEAVAALSSYLYVEKVPGG